MTEVFEIDLEQVEREMMELFSKHAGLGQIAPSTPMNEIRARVEQAGMMVGRAMGACSHEGPITADIAMRIRAFEEEYKERFLGSVTRVCGPGGELRQKWEAEDLE